MQRKVAKERSPQMTTFSNFFRTMPTLTKAKLLKVRTIRGHQPTCQDALNQLSAIHVKLIQRRKAFTKNSFLTVCCLREADEGGGSSSHSQVFFGAFL
jgi:hypothetical protein